MSLPGRIPDDPPITDHRKVAEKSLEAALPPGLSDVELALVETLSAVAHALLSIDSRLAKLPGHYRWVHR